MKQSRKAYRFPSKSSSNSRWPDIMSVEECASYLGVSKLSMYRLIREQDVPVKRVAGAFKVSRRQLLEWFESL